MTFLNSNPAIYNTMEFDGALAKWAKNDWYSKLLPVEQIGARWCPEEGRMKIVSPRVMTANTPWVHVKHLGTKHCALDHNVLFNMYGIIPPRCQECWKVTVTPNTFHQMMQLETLERKSGYACKVGMELRDYTPKFYGGYFYNNSFDEGRDCYKAVREMVDDMIDDGHEVDVILKRGCTEFEFIKGPSNYWHTTAEEEEFCELCDAYIDLGRGGLNNQSPVISTAIRLRWALWAHMNGDMTYMPYNGGKRLFPDYLKYHEGDREAIKHDLAISRAVVKGGVPAELAEEFYVLSKQFGEEKGVDPAQLAHVLGMNETNPLKLFNIKAMTPDILKGEHDETEAEFPRE